MHDDAVTWWMATAALVALELGSGSFYLLMLAVGAAAAALAAHLGVGVAAQAAVASAVGAGLVSLLAWRKRAAAADTRSNRDVLLDIDAQIRVDAWDDSGLARVRWRGTEWDARCTDAQPPHAGLHTIVGLDGNCLLLHALSAPATLTE